MPFDLVLKQNGPVTQLWEVDILYMSGYIYNIGFCLLMVIF